MSPAEEARQNIDHQLKECGWILQVRVALLPCHNSQLREILLWPEHQVDDQLVQIRVPKLP